MNIRKPLAVIGTNSWGGTVYGKLVRGSSVNTETLIDCMNVSKQCDLLIFDLAQDYGLGKAQKMIGEFGTKDIYLSSKYTPFGKYKRGQVRKSLERDLSEFKRDYVDIYWLHLPMDIEQNLAEMIELYKEGKIHYIGVSNFNLDECKKAIHILNSAGIPLYGVQNHYSIINREWEKAGLVNWCKENNILFWAWAVLEEGILTDPNIKASQSIMKLMFNRKKKRLEPLYTLMKDIGKKHNLNIPQVAMSFCTSKGIVPVCGCRKPYQVEQLYEAVNVTLTDDELSSLEHEADKAEVKILGADMFRFMVRK